MPFVYVNKLSNLTSTITSLEKLLSDVDHLWIFLVICFLLKEKNLVLLIKF